MRAECDGDVAGLESGQRAPSVGSTRRPGEQAPADACGIQQRTHLLGVLHGEDFGRRHHGRLRTGVGNRRQRVCRDQRLTCADIAK